MTTIPNQARAPSQSVTEPVALTIIAITTAVAMTTRVEGISQSTRNLALASVLGLATLFLVIVILRRRTFPKLLAKFWIFALSLVAIYTISIGQSPKITDALVTVLQLILVLSWVLFVSVTTWTNAITRTVYGLVSLFLLTSFYYWSAEGFNIKYEAFLTSKNILGAILFSSVFLLAYAKLVDNHILIRKSFVPLLAMCLALLWATASRGSQLSLLVSLVAYILWPLITRNKISQVLTFVFFFAATVSTVYFYLGMSQFGFFVALQDIFQQYTFAPLYSGREFVWPIIVDQIYQKPILGWGAGFREEEIVYNPEQGALSTHNLYLAVTLQSGLVGAGFLMGLLYSIWSAFCVAKTDPVVRLSGAFFLGICINQWFNLSLIQNNVSIGVLFWLVIGIGLNRAILTTRWGLHYETKPQTPS